MKRGKDKKNTPAIVTFEDSNFRTKYLAFINCCYDKIELKKLAKSLPDVRCPQRSDTVQETWEKLFAKYLTDFLFLGYANMEHNKKVYDVVTKKGKLNF